MAVHYVLIVVLFLRIFDGGKDTFYVVNDKFLAIKLLPN